jgi:hypothetical protein
MMKTQLFAAMAAASLAFGGAAFAQAQTEAMTSSMA